MEPQFHGRIGALAAELERRAGDLDAARVAIDIALELVGREDVIAWRESRSPGSRSRRTPPSAPATWATSASRRPGRTACSGCRAAIPGAAPPLPER